MTFGFVLVTLEGVNYIGGGGFLAVYVAGVTLAHDDYLHKQPDPLSRCDRLVHADLDIRAVGAARPPQSHPVGSRRGGNSQAVRRWFFMAIIVTMSETLPLANVKSRFSEMVDRVDRTHDRIIVTRNGRATAVLVSQGELDALEDTLDLLSDPEAMAQLEQSRREVGSGDVVTGEELRAQYPLK